MTVASDNELESQIAEWRAYMRRRRELHQTDAEELEDHLRSRITELTEAGLRADEAFLIAVKRMGSLDELSREFAREHSERLWKQLVLPGEPNAAAARSRRELPVMVLCAAVAALAIKVPSWFGLDMSGDDCRLLRAEPQPLRAAGAGRLLRLATPRRASRHRGARAAVRPRRGRRERVSAGRRLAEHRAHRDPPAARAVARRRRRLRGRRLAFGPAADGLHPLQPANG